MKAKIMEVVETHSTIIHLQAECIDCLFEQLMQYATVKEIERSMILDKIEQAVELQKGTEDI